MKLIDFMALSPTSQFMIMYMGMPIVFSEKMDRTLYTYYMVKEFTSDSAKTVLNSTVDYFEIADNTKSGGNYIYVEIKEEN